MLTIWMKIGMRTHLVNFLTCANICAFGSSRLFTVHNRTFRGGRTHERTNERTYCLHIRTVPLERSNRHKFKNLLLFIKENSSQLMTIKIQFVQFWLLMGPVIRGFQKTSWKFTVYQKWGQRENKRLFSLRSHV